MEQLAELLHIKLLHCGYNKWLIYFKLIHLSKESDFGCYLEI
jgi:hypothetical protein